MKFNALEQHMSSITDVDAVKASTVAFGPFAVDLTNGIDVTSKSWFEIIRDLCSEGADVIIVSTWQFWGARKELLGLFGEVLHQVYPHDVPREQVTVQMLKQQIGLEIMKLDGSICHLQHDSRLDNNQGLVQFVAKKTWKVLSL